MRASILGLFCFILICRSPGVAAQADWGIDNPGACPQEVNYAETRTYKCVVVWHATVPMDAKAVVSLIDWETGVVDQKEYPLSANNPIHMSTTLERPVCEGACLHTVWHLTVDLKIVDKMWVQPEQYDLEVRVEPEFPAGALTPLVLISLVLVMTATRKRLEKTR